MTVNVSPTAVNPSHHIKLTDSSATELGLICADAQGNRVSRVGVNPYPFYASQLRQGRGKHADRVPPFEDIPLSDFSGGLAMLHHDEDASKYLDGCRIDTSRAGEIINGGMETYTTGLRDTDESWPGNVSWASLQYGATTSKSVNFVAGTSYNVNSIVVILRKSGALTGSAIVTLLEGAAELKTKTLTIGTDCLTGVLTEHVEFVFASVQAITATTTYTITIEYSGTSPQASLQYAIDGSNDPYYRVLDDTGDFNILQFEYRGGIYCVTQPEDRSNSKLYQLGTRALADSNSGDKTYLVDADKDFRSSTGYGVAAGDLVKIIAGPGSEEDQPWREVSGAGEDNQIPVSPDWTVAHTTSTEYVVITDEWELLDTLDYYCTDVAVTDRVIHFAGGPDDVHHRARFGNDDGTWTFQGNIGTNEEADTFYSDRLLAIRHDSYKSERPVFDLYSSSLQENAADLNTTNAIKKLRTPPFWGEPYYILGQLTDNRGWMASEYANVDNYTDKGWAAIEWDATFTTGHVAGKVLDPPIDSSEAEIIMFAMKSDTALDAGDIQLKLLDGTDTLTLDFPAIYTGDDMHDDWYWYEIPIHADGAPIAGSDYPDFAALTYLNINVAVDKNAIVKLKIGQEGMLLATRNPNNERYELGLSERVNNMIEYGGGAGQVARKSWVGTNKNIYYIEDRNLKPIYLKEVEELEHYRNCEGMTVNDVYLYFNLGEKIQRYYSGHLDNIGPDADYGLPEDRRGIPCSMASYPGRVLVAIDAGSSGTSSVIYRKNHGWHEFYRAQYSGNRIRNIHIAARDDTVDRVYVSEGADVLWVPISLNPTTEADYEYTHESVLETSKIYGGLRETEKYYHALTLISEDIVAAQQNVTVEYKTSENSNWYGLVNAAIGTSFNTSPREKLDLSTLYNVSGRWIQLRIRGRTNDRTKTPKITSLILDTVERLDVNNTYSYTVELKEGTTNDLAGYQETQTGVAKLTQLETWVDSPLPLTLNTCSAFENGKLVFLEGVRKRVLYHTVDDKEQEVRLADLTLIEVT